MRYFLFLVMVVTALATTSPAVGPADTQDSIVVVLKDGTQKRFATADIARIEFESAKKTPASTAGQGRFLGKWRVGVGGGAIGTFIIDLDRDGQARKTIGSNRGTWVVVNGEARISWDDGWHDVIRKTGNHYEKAAYSPGKSFSDSPDNVASAEHTEANPI